MSITIIKKGTAAIESNKALTAVVIKGWKRHDAPSYFNGLNIPIQGGSKVIAKELTFLRDVARIRS